MEIMHGWLSSARRAPSPNYNARPVSCLVDAIIIHCISLPPEQFGGGYIEEFFQNRLDWELHPYFKSIEGMEVSAHLLITREAECIQFVSFDDRAWHAGQSVLEERNNCNDFSIGIELEGSDMQAFEAAQYERLGEVTRCLMAHYRAIEPQRIVGHSDVSPGRKTDPGPHFEWARFRAALSGDR